MTGNIELSIVILNYNTSEMTLGCISSLMKVENEANFEIILCDNGSTDDSVEDVADKYPKVIIIKNGSNLGFAKGNNTARGIVRGKYILFLNSDTIVEPGVIAETLTYLKKNAEVGAISCKLILPNGLSDPDARRRFPTPWTSFGRLFLRNGRKYWYGDVGPDNIQEVDVIQGAYFLTRKKILDDVGWFSEEYFLDGEDIDLCWKIKNKGFKIIYYPLVTAIHLKRGTKGKKTLKFKKSGVDSMEIFYRKWLWKKYPLVLNWFVVLGIRLLKLIRIVKNIF